MKTRSLTWLSIIAILCSILTAGVAVGFVHTMDWPRIVRVLCGTALGLAPISVLELVAVVFRRQKEPRP